MINGLGDLAERVLPRSTVLMLRVWRAMRGSGEPEQVLLPGLARSGCFVDVGANIGSWTGPASRIFRSVHSFEPTADIANALRRVAPANVTVHEIALSDRDGVGQFTTPIHRGRVLSTRASLEAHANDGFDRTSREVHLTTLDGLDIHGIDVIKIDVEGHEEAVLEGATKTIERERPALIIEIEERHHAGRSELIIQRLLDRGFMCFYVCDVGLAPFEPGSMGALQPQSLAPAPGQRAVRYINNFIFLPRERASEKSTLDDMLRKKGRQ